MNTFVKVISQQGMWGAVLATLTFVVIGFFVTKTGMFTKEINGKISKFVLTYAMPFLCIAAFMQNADKDNAKEVGVVIGFSLVFYLFAALFSWILIKFYPNMISKRVNKKALELWEKSDKTESEEKFKEAYLNSFRQKIMTSQMMLSYGSLQFFAYPLVIAMSGPIGSGTIFAPFTLALAQTWCIPYMIGAFSYVKMQYAGEKLSRSQIKPVLKSLFSPMMVCLYISLIIWALQFIPGLDKWFKPDADHKPYGLVYDLKVKGANQFWGGFQANLPVFGKIIGAGVGIISPLAWIIIGGSLAGSNIKQAMKDSSVWLTTVRKLVILPLVIFLITLVLVYPFGGDGTGLLSPATGTLLVLLAATPPAAVTMIFSVAYKHEHSGFTAQVSSLSTLLCLIAMPIWVVIANVTFKVIAG